MPAYQRDGGAWTESRMMARDGGEWTDSSHLGYVWTGSEWEEFQGTGALETLNAPENLTATPDYNDVDLAWTNPSQTTDPTNIQIRIAEHGAIWTEFDYPLTAQTWASLEEQTTYVAQIRYLIRTAGVATAYSPITHVEFTTTAAPLGAPAEDPGGTGGETIIPSGTNTTTPTNPGVADGCWWEYKLQILDEDAYTWTDTAISGTAAGNVTQFDVDLGTLDGARTYRFAKRQACDTDSDTVADEWGDWVYGDPFPGVNDWDVSCGGVTAGGVLLSSSAIGDAVWRFPKHCLIDGDLVMTEAVGGTEVMKGAGFYSFFTSSGGDQGALPLPTQTSAPFLPSMVAALPTTITKGSDWSIIHQFQLLASFSLSNGRVTTVATFGGGAVVIKATESATGITFTADVLADGGGFVTLTTSELSVDTNPHQIALTWDADGTKTLYLDDSSEDTDTGTDVYETVNTMAGVVSSPAYYATLQQAGWTRVLTANEIGEAIDRWATASEVNFTYSGTIQQWTVPAGVTQIRATMNGGSGGAGADSERGRGAKLVADRSVSPGQIFNVWVGARGAGGGPNGGGGGWPNGGEGGIVGSGNSSDGYGGGGSSSLALGAGSVLADAELIVAGGGGHSDGNNAGTKGGDGGAPDGDDASGSSTYIGRGATQSAGGAQANNGTGQAGSAFNGGNGDGGGSFAEGGGGGGGGYYGGSGGGGDNVSCGGGGGGSSWIGGNWTEVSMTDPNGSDLSADGDHRGHINIKYLSGAVEVENWQSDRGSDWTNSPASVSVLQDDVIFAVVTYRDSGSYTIAAPGTPTGTATVESWSAVTSQVDYDTLGTSRGAVRVYAARVTGAGTITDIGHSDPGAGVSYTIVDGLDVSTSSSFYGTVTTSTATEETDTVSHAPGAATGTADHQLFIMAGGMTAEVSGIGEGTLVYSGGPNASPLADTNDIVNFSGYEAFIQHWARDGYSTAAFDTTVTFPDTPASGGIAMISIEVISA